MSRFENIWKNLGQEVVPEKPDFTIKEQFLFDLLVATLDKGCQRDLTNSFDDMSLAFFGSLEFGAQASRNKTHSCLDLQKMKNDKEANKAEKRAAFVLPDKVELCAVCWLRNELVRAEVLGKSDPQELGMTSSVK